MNTLSQSQQNGAGLPAPAALVPSDYDLQVPGSQEVALSEVMYADEAQDALRHPITLAEPGSAPALQTDSLPGVYAQAGVPVPGHGFTILKVADMLGSSHLRSLSLEAKRAAILMALEANNVQVNDVIEDAARRDLALNQYEARQQKTFQDFKTWKLQQNQEIQAEIDLLVEACRSRIETNDKEVAHEKARLDEWRGQKREEEKRIRSASSHFVSGGDDQPSVVAEPVLGVVVAPQPEVAPTKAKPVEARAPESPAVTNGKGTPARTPASENGGKRASLWKR
ncbi:MAG TPA: hypothetical protein VNW97_05420 [Candidatus Saccharimonadales bacterium]|nr:hypothetical protein [Candidatus Saccharimonadales bacterium]